MNDLQLGFLQSYQNSNGEVNSAIRDNGLELNHFRLWMRDDDDEFNRQFNIIRSEIIYEQLAEFRILIARQLNQLLTNGYTETVTTRTTTTNKNGRTTIKKTTKTVKKPVPIVMVKELLLAESFETSVINLSQKGVIPKTIARNLLSTANEYTNKLQAAFGVDAKDDNSNDEKTIGLIKQALIGSSDDIQ